MASIANWVIIPVIITSITFIRLGIIVIALNIIFTSPQKRKTMKPSDNEKRQTSILTKLASREKVSDCMDCGIDFNLSHPQFNMKIFIYCTVSPARDQDWRSCHLKEKIMKHGMSKETSGKSLFRLLWWITGTRLNEAPVFCGYSYKGALFQLLWVLQWQYMLWLLNIIMWHYDIQY